jgi:hypothetical protein
LTLGPCRPMIAPRRNPALPRRRTRSILTNSSNSHLFPTGRVITRAAQCSGGTIPTDESRCGLRGRRRQKRMREQLAFRPCARASDFFECGVNEECRHLDHASQRGRIMQPMEPPIDHDRELQSVAQWSRKHVGQKVQDERRTLRT